MPHFDSIYFSNDEIFVKCDADGQHISRRKLARIEVSGIPSDGQVLEFDLGIETVTFTFRENPTEPDEIQLVEHGGSTSAQSDYILDKINDFQTTLHCTATGGEAVRLLQSDPDIVPVISTNAVVLNLVQFE